MFGYVKAGPGITETEYCITQYLLHFFSWKLKKEQILIVTMSNLMVHLTNYY